MSRNPFKIIWHWFWFRVKKVADYAVYRKVIVEPQTCPGCGYLYSQGDKVISKPRGVYHTFCVWRRK